MTEHALIELGPDGRPLRDTYGRIKRLSNSTGGDLAYLRRVRDEILEKFPQRPLEIVEIAEAVRLVETSAPAADLKARLAAGACGS